MPMSVVVEGQLTLAPGELDPRLTATLLLGKNPPSKRLSG
jgi:hypothetical protein